MNGLPMFDNLYLIRIHDDWLLALVSCLVYKYNCQIETLASNRVMTQELSRFERLRTIVICTQLFKIMNFFNFCFLWKSLQTTTILRLKQLSKLQKSKFYFLSHYARWKKINNINFLKLMQTIIWFAFEWCKVKKYMPNIRL